MTETREELAKRLIKEMRDRVDKEKEADILKEARPKIRTGIGPDYMYDQFGDIYD